MAFVIRNVCELDYYAAYDGDEVLGLTGSTWGVRLAAPVAEGHTWTWSTLDYHWEPKGSVQTPAGTFDDCWSLVPAGYGETWM